MHAVEQRRGRSVAHLADRAGVGAAGDAFHDGRVELAGARRAGRPGMREAGAAGHHGTGTILQGEIIAMKDGQLFTQGTTQEMIKKDVLDELYEMDIRICEIEGRRFCLYF